MKKLSLEITWKWSKILSPQTPKQTFIWIESSITWTIPVQKMTLVQNSSGKSFK